MDDDGRAALRPAAADGGLLRVLDDARARRPGPEAAGRAVLPVHQRGGGLHQGAVHRGRDAARARRSSTSRRSPAGTTLQVLDYERASEVIRTATRRSASACATAATRWRTSGRACDAPMDICMTFNTRRPLADPARLRAPGRRRRVPRPACSRRRRDSLVQFGENVRERRELHLQLLRLLLRGDDRGAPLRPPAPGPHHELPARGRRGRLQRLRQVRRRRARWRRWPGLGARPARATGKKVARLDEERLPRAAASACGRARATRWRSCRGRSA